MAHFAELNDNNTVLRVVVVSNEHEHRGEEYLRDDCKLGGRWIQTSYNGNIRGQYCGTGYSYDEVEDVFLPPKPYASWLRNGLGWQAPTPRPEEGFWSWNEETLSWDEIILPTE